MAEKHDEFFNVKVVQHSITGGLFIEVTPQMREIIPIGLGTRLRLSRTKIDTDTGWKEGIIIEREEG
jgi:hypothetical protein